VSGCDPVAGADVPKFGRLGLNGGEALPAVGRFQNGHCPADAGIPVTLDTDGIQFGSQVVDQPCRLGRPSRDAGGIRSAVGIVEIPFIARVDPKDVRVGRLRELVEACTLVDERVGISRRLRLGLVRSGPELSDHLVEIG